MHVGILQFVTPRAVPIVDLDRGGHAGRKNDARRHLIDVDADRNALGQSHPVEGWIDIGKQGCAGAAVAAAAGAGATASSAMTETGAQNAANVRSTAITANNFTPATFMVHSSLFDGPCLIILHVIISKAHAKE